MKKLLPLLFLLCIDLLGSAQSTVYLVPTLHGLHRTNEAYSYDSLRNLVARLRPDVIAVEIRAEDIGQDTAYLGKNYPYEMWMMRSWFPGTVIEGFDWLGTELEGRPVPGRYWQDSSRIKALERLRNLDTVVSGRLAGCRLYQSEREKLLAAASLKELLHSNDAILVREYYDCLRQKLQGSDYAALTDFYDTRNRRMQQRLGTLVQQHPNKTIVILTGDDHYPYLATFLRAQPGLRFVLPI